MFHLNVIDRLKFYLERQLAKGALYQLLSVWCLVGILSIIAGTLISVLHGADEPLSDSVWWAFLRLSDPGYLGDDEGFWRRLVSTILTVLGYVLFMGTLVAIMTQWLFSKMRTLERGLTPVALRQHITILGWTSRTVPILLDILGRGRLENREQTKRIRTRIAVLADDITDGASAQFYSHPELARQRRQVVLRSGSKLNPQHLHRVAAAQSQVVVIPSQATGGDRMLSADAEAIKVLLSLNAQCPADKLPTAIVELQSAEKIPLARHSYQGPLQLVASDVAIARAFSQSVMHQGLSDVLDALLVDTDGCQLYLSSARPLQGKTWRDIRGHYRAAIACGIVQRINGHAKPLLAPADGVVIGRDDALILLANAEKDIVLVDPSVETEPRLPRADWPLTELTTSALNVLVLGWNSRAPVCIEQLREGGGGALQLTAISTLSGDERQAQLQSLEPSWQFIDADYTLPSVLQRQDLSGYDSIIVFASDRLERGEEADARSIVANQLLDYLLEDAEVRPQVLVELTDPNNAIYVSANKEKLRSEVVQSSAIISHLLAQLAVYPELRTVYDHLLSPDGVSLHVRPVPPQWYGTVSFNQLQQGVAEMGAVLLGVRSGNDRAQLNLSPNQRVTCNQSTYLVVMGE